MKSLTAFIIIIISIALLGFYAWPQWQTVSVLQDKNTQLQDAQLKAQELSQLRNNLVTQYNSISREDIEKVGKVVPKQYDPVKLTADINAIAMRYGMVIKNVSFTKNTDISSTGTGAVVDAPPTTPYKVVTVAFSTEGSYKDFTLLLADLEKNLQILDIKNVDITAKSVSVKDKVAPGSLDFKITLDTYWMN
jgi:Tfp pilus assembly protein PilO